MRPLKQVRPIALAALLALAITGCGDKAASSKSTGQTAPAAKTEPAATAGTTGAATTRVAPVTTPDTAKMRTTPTTTDDQTDTIGQGY